MTTKGDGYPNEPAEDVFQLVAEAPDPAVYRARLAGLINHMVNTNIEKLYAILYRLDISETRLKQLLKEAVGIDAGIIIADLIIERQLQKIKTRREYGRGDDTTDAEKW